MHFIIKHYVNIQKGSHRSLKKHLHNKHYKEIVQVEKNEEISTFSFTEKLLDSNLISPPSPTYYKKGRFNDCDFH